MSALQASLLTALVTFVLTGVGTYFTSRRNLQQQFDASLRDLRIDVYKKLWKDLEALAKYARTKEKLSTADARNLSAAMRRWYFSEGGLFLSEATRGDYFALQDGLELIGGSDRSGEEHEDSLLTDAEFEYLRVLGSRVRTGMTRDVGTRRTFIFRGVDAPDDLPDTPVFREEARRPDRGEARESEGRRLEVVLTRRLQRSLHRPVVRRPSALLVGPERERIEVGSADWDPGRMALTTRELPGRDGDRRRLVIEDDLIVEGPEGWEPGAEESRPPPTVWRHAPDE